MSAHGYMCNCGRVSVWRTRRWIDGSRCWVARRCGSPFNITAAPTHAEALAAAWAHIKEHS